MAPTEAGIVPILPSDLRACQALVEAAGWNQTEADWRFMLAHGRGRGFRDGSGRLVASSMLLSWPPNVGWIGMVLVDGSHRRRGYATRLLRHLIALCREDGLIPMLDATPAGREVYSPLGFAAGEGIERWRRNGTAAVTPDAPVDLSVLTSAIRLDLDAMGASRQALLADLVSRAGAPAVSSGKAVLLGRPGRTALHLGPLLSPVEADALALCGQVLDTLSGPLLMDVPVREAGLRELLDSRGFVVERSFTRMACGAVPPLGSAMRAISGPEYG